MRETVFQNRFIRSVAVFGMITALSMCLGTPVTRAGAAERGGEKRERTVDAAALASQKESIARLKDLVIKNRGKVEEPALLQRLAEALQDAASIEFRIVHGPAATKNRSADLTQYRAYLRSSIGFLKELIARYPNAAEPAHHHAMLARAYDEVGSRAEAEREYRYLVKSFPRAREVSAAYLALAEMATAARDHALAIRYLSEIEKRDEDPRYPFALHRLAWAYYNLKQPGKALAYLEKTADVSRDNLRELALLDVPAFYLEGREQKLPQYASELAPSYFNSLDQGPLVGRMIIQYAKLLRAHSLVPDLIAFKNVLVETRADRPETFEVVTVAFEDQLNHRRFGELASSANEIASLHRKSRNKEVLDRAQKLLLDSAAEIQKLIVKNRDADGVLQLNRSLADIYAAFARLVDEDDPRLARVHYNLAESLFATKQYDAASAHYLWLRTGSNVDPKVRDEATQKLIASRYEGLRARNAIPKEFKAQAIGSAKPGDLDSYAREWIDWVDARQSELRGASASNDSFYFEACRMIYASGDIARGVERLRKFALEHRSSPFAQPSAALVLDTFVAGADWKKLQELIASFLGVTEWKVSALHARLERLNAEVAFKRLEAQYKAGSYAEALDAAERYINQHPRVSNDIDAMTVAAHSALALKDHGKARRYLSDLIATAAQTEAGATALLSRGSLNESSLDFDAAAKDYQQWLDLPSRLVKSSEKNRGSLRARVLTLWWVSNNVKSLERSLHDSRICDPQSADLCDRFRALAYLLGGDRGRELTLRAFYRSRRAPLENRPLWAALALEGAKHLVFRDRNVTLHHLMANWKVVDPLYQTYLVSSLSKSLPEVFRLNRKGIQEVAPLVLNERYLTYRMQILKEYESIAAKVTQLPWARVRAAVLNEVASAYLDVSTGMAQIAAKKGVRLDVVGLVQPFEQKAQKIRTNAFEIASNSAVEEEQLDSILAPFMQANPAVAKDLRHDRVRRPRALDQFALELLDPENSWRKASRPETCLEPKICAIARFGAAIRAENWAQVAYLVHELHQGLVRGRELDSVQLGLARTAAFSAMGAQAEGLKELAAVSTELSSELRQKSSVYLLVHYFRSLSKQMTRQMLERLRSTGLPDSESEGSVDIASAAQKWIGG